MAVMIQIITVIATVAFLLIVTSAHEFQETGYALTVSSRLRGGQNETVCVHIIRPSENIILTINFQMPDQEKIVFMERNISQDLYHCADVKVPQVTDETVAEVSIILEGEKDEMRKTTKVLVVPSGCTPVIQSAKPVYKPGETVKFRIAILDEDFLACKGKFESVGLQDPNSNLIEQWVDQDFSEGIIDFSFELSSEASKGTYTIVVITDIGEEHNSNFAVEEYVLPKYEVIVQMPSVVTILDGETSFNICGRYTYGKPVNGSIKAFFCIRTYDYWRFRPEEIVHCETYNMRTNTSGCATQQVNMTEIFLTGFMDVYAFELTADLTEDNTGLTQSGSASMEFSQTLLKAEFIDTPSWYSNGLEFGGQVKITGPDGKPVPSVNVTVTDDYGQIFESTTESDGVASFSLDTHQWTREPEPLKATLVERPVPYYRNFGGYYGRGYHYAYKMYSPSNSTVKIMQVRGEISCDKDVAVGVQYIIQGTALKEGQDTLAFYFLVISRGQIINHGSVHEPVKSVGENKGNITINLNQVTNLAPYAQVVVYTLLHSREIVADSRDFPIQLCFNNKVSVEFSSPQYFPGRKASLNLQAEPGSLCSVRAIDQSVLLLADEEKITVDRIFDLLSVKKIQQYDDRIIGPCERVSESRVWHYYFLPPSSPQGEYAAKQFEKAGVKIETNYLLKDPLNCVPPDTGIPTFITPHAPARATIRKAFPEYWIWSLISVGKNGSVDLKETIPDTITSWLADAFCVSPVGFGLAKRSKTTTFKSFFVSLTLPFSVIRGEAFTLKATVFNYESKCLRLKITLANSKEYDFKNCTDCLYQECLCGEDSSTFSWIVTPKVIGLLNVTVTAEAMKDGDVCGEKPTTVPEEGQLDTVIRSLLVEPEGLPQMASVNRLICSTDNTVKETMSLVVPENTVEGSVKGFVTVLGDLLDSALNNLEDLLRMPYGCGEQAMLSYAPNVVIIQHLEDTGQLTPIIQQKAVDFMKTGYSRVMRYRHKEGGYSAFGIFDESAETWLTAFVVKTLSQSQSYISVDEEKIREDIQWLSEQQNSTTGCFRSVGKLFDNSIKGGVSDDVTLTAYVVAALLEVNNVTSDAMVQEGLRCLKDALKGQIDNLFAIALMSYTFSLAKDIDMRENLLKQLHNKSIEEGGTRYLPRPGAIQPDSLEVEMTSYFLLAVLHNPTLPDFDFDYAAQMVRWLVKQTNPRGGFSSTQDTVVGLQALGKFSFRTNNTKGTNKVNVATPNGGKIKFIVDQSNKLIYQEEPLDEDNMLGEYNVTVEGDGCLLVKLSVYYNIPPPSDFSYFSVSTDIKRKCGSNSPVFDLSVTVSYIGPRDVTNMVIVDIKLLSGHSLDEESEKELNYIPNVKKVEQKNGHVLIYMKELRKDEKKTYNLRQHMDEPFEHLSPAVIDVYDYYLKSEEASLEYNYTCSEEPPILYFYIVNWMV